MSKDYKTEGLKPWEFYKEMEPGDQFIPDTQVTDSFNHYKSNHPKLNLKPNVIDGSELRILFEAVFDDMSKYVARTYGPYGENTGYQLRDKILMTKDGWTVEQEFTYSKNLLANIIRKIIIDVSNSIYLHAGDGTSTGLISANLINKGILAYKDSMRIHSKTLTAAIKFCTAKICDKLKRSTRFINDDSMSDTIYRIACVSLDWDAELAGFIKEIYEETHNPLIQVRESGTDTSYVSYVTGYDLSGRLITNYKINEIATRTFVIEKPAIMVFSHSVPGSLFEGLLSYVTNIPLMLPGVKEFVIMAPDFDKGFKDSYSAICASCIQNHRPMINMTLVQYDVNFNVDRDMLDDFCFLIGASLITADMRDYENALKDCGKLVSLAADHADMKNLKTVREQIFATINSFDVNHGCCERFSVNEKSIVASGFGDIEQSEELQKRIGILESEIDAKRRDFNAKSMFADDIRIKMMRLSRLKLRSGIINVGGFGEDIIKSTKDALDDAINACSAAYTDGVVVGGNIATIKAVDEVLMDLDNAEDLGSDKVECYDIKMMRRILGIIRDGYIDTTVIMYENKYGHNYKMYLNETDSKDYMKQFPNDLMTADDNGCISISLRDLVKFCVARSASWNLIGDELDASIIHPVRVETEILKGCLHLVLTTSTMNQLFYHGYEGIDNELRDMREVPVEGVPENPLDKLR